MESPRTSWGGTSKLGGPPQTPPLSPHEDDLSLVLGTMQVSRSRSYSTTVTPKVQSDSVAKDIAPSSMLEKTRNVVMRRKKSVPTSASKTEKVDSKYVFSKYSPINIDKNCKNISLILKENVYFFFFVEKVQPRNFLLT